MQALRAPVCLGWLCLLVACADHKSAADKPTAGIAPSKEIMVTYTDPRDPRAWAQARALAEQAIGGPVTRKSDALPFLFAGNGKVVLIHKGTVVGARGPAAAGAYLRDLGIIVGEGPQIDDVLVVLDALDALPAVDGVDMRAYVKDRTDEKLRNLAPFIETDGTTASVVLSYFVSGPPVVKIDPDPTHKPQVGARIQTPTPVLRPLAVMRLQIPTKGDASWKREDVNWHD